MRMFVCRSLSRAGRSSIRCSAAARSRTARVGSGVSPPRSATFRPRRSSIITAPIPSSFASEIASASPSPKRAVEASRELGATIVSYHLFLTMAAGQKSLLKSAARCATLNTRWMLPFVAGRFTRCAGSHDLPAAPRIGRSAWAAANSNESCYCTDAMNDS